MKAGFYSIITGVIVIFAVVLIMIISGRDIHEEEIEKALSLSLMETMENIAERGTLNIENSSSFEEDFKSQLEEKLRGDGDKDFSIDLEFLSSDNENGLLSVKATEHFSYPNGKTGEVTAKRTIVLSEEKAENLKTATYLFDKEAAKDLGVSEVYGRYEFIEERDLITPPEVTGKAFYGWEIVRENGVKKEGSPVFIRREEERVDPSDVLIENLDKNSKYEFRSVYKEFYKWEKEDNGKKDELIFTAKFKRI